MARNSEKNGREKKNGARDAREEKEPRLHHETKKSIWALLCIAMAIVLLLASAGRAGPVGQLLYAALERLLGWGYYLAPLTFFILAGVFLVTDRRRVYLPTLAGAGLFVFAGLGLIDLFAAGKGGFIGDAAGLLAIPLGSIAATVVLCAALLVALLIMLNVPIRLRTMIDKMKERKPAIANEEPPAVVIAEEKAPPQPMRAPKDEKKKETRDEEESEETTPRPQIKIAAKHFKNYVPPPMGLLKSSIEKPTSGDLRANANIIKRTLESFGIAVEMGEINIGPKVTRYTLKPAEGVKLSRLTALNPDLALALAAHPIRIEAPIPGKSLVGIEVPNKASAVVRLGSLMAYPDFMGSGPLGFVLGRDVNGEPLFADIAKMPHLLIAGSTGSGKSIMIHALLVSLLYKNSPDMLRLILVDPKRVELSLYNDLPHLISPVITEAKKTVGVFRWAIVEMDRRYEMLLKAGSRDIQSYNKKYPDEPLPYLVIVIDELADLMASYGREIEGSIVRLAQMARATGLHLVLSTQRPSVEVVTGLIKANITSRVALQLPSQVDSRTVLDTAGAEKLLGGGDMLFVSSEISKPRRIQGAYLSEEEVKRVTDFIRKENGDIAEERIAFENGGNGMQPPTDDMLSEYGNGDDDLLEEAVRVVREADKASASLLQRRLKVGYARAARLLDIMEERGIVGPGDGAKPREVFMERQEHGNE